MRTALAIVWLHATDLALVLYTASLKALGVTRETSMFRRLNHAVARADRNPHLPARYRDPRDA